MKIRTALEHGQKTLRIIPETDFVASHIDDLKEYCLKMINTHSDVSNIVLDVCGVDLIDSLGVNLIVGLYREAESNHQTIQIVGAEKNFLEVAGFFRLGSLFPIHAKVVSEP